MQDDIKADLVNLRDNYMRQMPGRPREAFAYIAGKVEALNAALVYWRDMSKIFKSKVYLYDY